MDPEVQKIAAKQADKEPISCRPVEAPGAVHKHMDDLRKELKDKNFPSDDEHCVIHAMFPPQLEKHLKGEGPKPKPVALPSEAPKAAPTAPAAASSSNGPQKRYGLTINGKKIEVGVEEIV